MPLPAESTANRKIRSFVRRQGRLTQGQQKALEQHWDKYCLDPGQLLDAGQVFGRTAPLVLEIGFGNGTCLAQMAVERPGQDYLGIEVHRPGVGHLIQQLEERQITNARIICHDAVEVLEKCIADNSLAGVHLFFPDPWPKLKHHKRRIVQPEFIALVAKKLQPGGYFHAATDWQHYAEHMLAVLSDCAALTNNCPAKGYSDRPYYRPLTKFEQRGLRLGHGVWDLVFVRK